MRSILLLLFLPTASGALAQSIMVSPQEVLSVGFTQIPPEAGTSRAKDHSGLLTDFISGATGWDDYMDGDFCEALHQPDYVLEFWGSVPAGSTPQVILDMGAVGLWDRAAVFNEESMGFGLGPLVIEEGDGIDGPWAAVGSWWLSPHPNDSAYGPDVLDFPGSVETRYFRMSTTAPDNEGTVQLSLGEVILGTADAQAPRGPCLSGSIVQVPDHTFGAITVTVGHQGDGVRLILAPAHAIRAVQCVDALGRSIPATVMGCTVEVPHPAQGSYAFRLITSTGTVVRGRFLVPW